MTSPKCLCGTGVRPENLLDLYSQRGQFFSRGRPHDVQVDIEIRMDEPIPHADNVRPRNLRLSTPALIGYFCSRFADDLDFLDQREHQHPVAVQIRFFPACEKCVGLPRCIDDMPQANLIIR